MVFIKILYLVVIKKFILFFHFKRAITNGLLPLGAVFAGLTCEIFSNLLGIRDAIICTNIIVLIAAILNILSKYVNSFVLFMISRFVHGICVGFFSGLFLFNL